MIIKLTLLITITNLLRSRSHILVVSVSASLKTISAKIKIILFKIYEKINILVNKVLVVISPQSIIVWC